MMGSYATETLYIFDAHKKCRRVERNLTSAVVLQENTGSTC